MNTLIDLSLLDMALSLVLVIIALGVSFTLGLGIERTLLWATFRTVVQLVAAGYVVHVLFGLDRPLPVLGLLVLMLLVAAWTATGRQKLNRRRTVPLTLFSLAVGAGVTILIVVHGVVGVRPWYEPRYLIPLGGMILGNSMNGAALALERLERELRQGKRQVEAVLALGGSPKQASVDAERQAVRAALLPTMNSMMVVGLVQLPGIMTGQILAGAEPLTAVRYQMVVMFMLLSAVSITTAIAVRGIRRRYYTEAWQLRLPE